MEIEDDEVEVIIPAENPPPVQAVAPRHRVRSSAIEVLRTIAHPPPFLSER